MIPKQMNHAELNTRGMARALILQAGLTLFFLVFLLRLWRMDLNVPFNYWGDTLFQLVVAKNIADGGWIWWIGGLGAPFGLAIVAFPQNLTTTSIIIAALSVFSKEPGFLLNVYWLLTIVFASVNAHVSLRVLGYRQPTAFVLATLYALLPYAFYRNVAHLPVVYPFIPVLAAFAVQLASNSAGTLKSKWGKYVLICAVAQGFDYVYCTAFSVFIFIVAGFLAYFYHCSSLQARRAGVLCVVLSISSIANLAPTFLEWHKHGKPPNTGYKSPAEAEVYGLKLRQLLSPVQPSQLAVVRRFGEHERQFPNENENTTTRLGTILSIGLLGMLGQFLFRQNLSDQVRAAAALTLACFLLATVGGFGAIFNILVTPDIRAYNRIVVFIAFFIIVYLAAFIDSCQARLEGRFAKRGGRGSSFAVGIVLAAVLVFGVLDQGQAARPLVEGYAGDAASFREERALVAEIERRYPAGGAVMQLPETIFPADGGRARMRTYDHARPFLTSTKLSWSWPAFSHRHEAWYNLLGAPTDVAFPSRLLSSGFIGIWLDRFGYDPAELDTIERALTARLGAPLVGGREGRYAYFDLTSFDRSSGLATRAPNEREWLLNPLLLKFGPGFYEEERNGDRRHRWSGREATLRMQNSGETSQTAVFRTLIQSGQAGLLRIAIEGRPMDPIEFSATETKPVSIAVTVPALSSVDVTFAFDGPALVAPGDTRTMYFGVVNARLEAP